MDPRRRRSPPGAPSHVSTQRRGGDQGGIEPEVGALGGVYLSAGYAKVMLVAEGGGEGGRGGVRGEE